MTCMLIAIWYSMDSELEEKQICKVVQNSLYKYVDYAIMWI